MTTEDVPEARVHDSELEFEADLVYKHNGRPFSGVGYEETNEGGLSEINYRNGLQDGPARDRYPSGRIKGESYFRENILHGRSRDFDENGNVTQESVYEYGIMVSWVRRDADDNTLETFKIGSSDPAFELLARYREDKRWS